MSLYDTRYGSKGRIVCDIKRNATGLVCDSLTGFECFIARDCVNSLDFSFEKREVVSTVVKVLDEFLARNVKHMRRNRRARLNGMARLVCRGWHDDCRRYWCLCVGLV